MATNLSLYASTHEGLFRIRLTGGPGAIEPLGLKGYSRVFPIAVDREDPRRLYAATHRGGMFRSTDAGRSWAEINSGLFYKEAWCVVQHPATGELFVGTGPASVFISADRGDSWRNCDQLHTLGETKDWTFPGPPFIAHVKGLSISPEDPKLILGAVEEGWIIRSRDGGKTWSNLKNGTEHDSHTVNVIPGHADVLLSTSGTGAYRSTDGGDHFAPANEGLTRRYMAQMVLHPEKPDELYTAAAEVPPHLWRRPEGANAKFFRSDDQGRSWIELNGKGLPAHFKAAPRATAGIPRQPGSFLVGMTDGSVWLTQDRGESFAEVAKGLPPISGLAVAVE